MKIDSSIGKEKYLFVLDTKTQGHILFHTVDFPLFAYTAGGEWLNAIERCRRKNLGPPWLLERLLAK
jgi:hypothetical protein